VINAPNEEDRLIRQSRELQCRATARYRLKPRLGWSGVFEGCRNSRRAIMKFFMAALLVLVAGTAAAEEPDNRPVDFVVNPPAAPSHRALWLAPLVGACVGDAVTTTTILHQGGRETFYPSQNAAVITGMIAGQCWSASQLTKPETMAAHPRLTTAALVGLISLRVAAVVANGYVLTHRPKGSVQ
jgi:hypothetical protein